MSKSSFLLIPEVMLIFYAMTHAEISKLNMNNYKLKKTSIKLIPFGSTIQNSFTGVKDPVCVLLKTEKHFANAMFYVTKDNVTNIIRDLEIWLFN